MNDVYVFLGPSISHAEAARIAPSVMLRPPIRRGDLAAIAGPATVGIIDGVFDAVLAVSPQEIRDAMDRGVRVMGASSMGALRAAEVRGMVGIGRVYELYRSGRIDRDDEVAVLLDTDSGRALTVPLVNVRHAVERLVREGSLDAEWGKSIVDAASRLHFHDRVYRNILREAGAAPGPETDAVARALGSIDLKREDALSLLEELPVFAEAPAPTMSAPPDGTTNERASRNVVAARAPADGPVLLWEHGELVDFDDLVTFLALSGSLDRIARRALVRFLADGGELDAVEASPEDATVQDLFERTATVWGWRTGEEGEVTCADLGIDPEALASSLAEERTLRRQLRTLFETRPAPFLAALRSELFFDDLGLKREAFRLGALLGLARRASSEPLSDDERRESKRAFINGRPELTWAGLLAESSTSEDRATPIVDLVARARRVGIAFAERLEAPGPIGTLFPFLSTLPEARRAASATHTLDEREAMVLASDLAGRIGVTRIAQLGELERFGLHVAAAYRASRWSSTLGSGKSETREGAAIGAVMEEIEKYCQERFVVDVLTEGRAADLPRAVDPRSLALPYDTSYRDGDVIAWSWAVDLVTGERHHVPAAALAFGRAPRDPYHSPRRGSRIFSTNGVASAFTLTEALVHALCERIERHATKLAEQTLSNPGRLPDDAPFPFVLVDLASCPASVRRIVAAIEGAGWAVRAMDITCAVAVPTFAVRVSRRASLHGLEDAFCSGACTHPDPAVALARAFLEAIQNRVAALSGAREDLDLKTRSLGRHERPRPLSRGDAYWLRPYLPRKPLAKGPEHGSAREDLAFVVGCLTAAGFGRILYRELSGEDVAPAHVVRTLIPDFEDTNPFFTGPTARAHIVKDLLRSHVW